MARVRRPVVGGIGATTYEQNLARVKAALAETRTSGNLDWLGDLFEHPPLPKLPPIAASPGEFVARLMPHHGRRRVRKRGR